MLAKLKKGDHPDTDPHFWDGAPAMPSFQVHGTVASWWQHDVMTIEHQMWLGLVFCFGTPILLFYAVVKARRKYRKDFPKAGA